MGALIGLSAGIGAIRTANCPDRQTCPQELIGYVLDSLETKQMEQIELSAARRTVEKGGAKRIREQGRVPGIVYGHGFENVPLHMEALELTRILTEAGASSLIHLRIDDASVTQPVLAREIQRDVLTGDPIHVDFLAVSMTERITAEVTINLVGEPDAVTTGDGLLLQGANTLEIECLPGDLIPSLDVDVSGLELHSAIYVADLQVPATVMVLSDPQELIAQVVPERLEEEVEEAVEEFEREETGEVEVISRGRAEEDRD
jgi:large subunit ribosomal protein L25